MIKLHLSSPEISGDLRCSENMQDITGYSDAELSLVVFNDEGLYRFVRRTYNLSRVREYLEEIFTFTTEQWEDLVETIEADREEDADAPQAN